jgi:hypothetical protein
MGGRGGDLVPDLGRRREAPPQEGARRGEEPLRLGTGGGSGAGAGADEGGEAPRECPAPGHLAPEIGGGGAGGGAVSLGKKSETEGEREEGG